MTQEAGDFIIPLCHKLGEGAMKRFHAQITLPAVAFASALRRSTSRYCFTFIPASKEKSTVRPTLLTTGNKPRAVYGHDIRVFNLIDMDSGKALKADQQITANKDGIIGEQAMIVHPALCRSVRDGPDVALGKPLVLVKLLQPLHRRGIVGSVSNKLWS